MEEKCNAVRWYYYSIYKKNNIFQDKCGSEGIILFLERSYDGSKVFFFFINIKDTADTGTDK